MENQYPIFSPNGQYSAFPQQYGMPPQQYIPPQYGQPQQFFDGASGMDANNTEQTTKSKEKRDLEFQLENGCVLCYYVVQWNILVLEILIGLFKVLGINSNTQQIVGLLVNIFVTYCAIASVKDKSLGKATIAYVIFMIQAFVLAIASIAVLAFRSYIISLFNESDENRKAIETYVNFISVAGPIFLLIHILLNHLSHN